VVLCFDEVQYAWNVFTKAPYAYSSDDVSKRRLLLYIVDCHKNSIIVIFQFPRPSCAAVVRFKFI